MTRCEHCGGSLITEVEPLRDQWIRVTKCLMCNRPVGARREHEEPVLEARHMATHISQAGRKALQNLRRAQ